jgi:hypothetical protein
MAQIFASDNAGQSYSVFVNKAFAGPTAARSGAKFFWFFFFKKRTSYFLSPFDEYRKSAT